MQPHQQPPARVWSPLARFRFDEDANPLGVTVSTSNGRTGCGGMHAWYTSCKCQRDR
jgi:hypothetical protein